MEYSLFQRDYLLVYAVVTLADWLQGTHFHALYESHGLTQEQTANLFLSGFVSSAVFGTFVGGVVDRVGKVGDAKSFAKRADVVEAGRVRSAAVVVADRDGVPGGHMTHAWDGQQVRLRQPEAAERDDDVLRVLGCMRRGRRCGRAATWLAVPAARGCGDTGLRSELLRKAEREDQGNDTEHRCLQVISSVSCTNAFFRASLQGSG